MEHGDPLDREWAKILRGEHPLSAWLDGDEPFERMPSVGGFLPRQLFSSHPFRVEHPWSIRVKSDESSSTLPD
jgi:hypothetical protein